MNTEEALRTICLKLSMTESYLQSVPKDSTFVIDIVTHQSGHVALSANPKCQDFLWIINDDSRKMKDTKLLPIKTLKTEFLMLQLYALEDEKSKLSNS